jgi:hypothetical protein
MYKLSYKEIPAQWHRTYYSNANELITFFDKEIWLEDSRSKTMPSISIGLVIGITYDKILLRTNNNITQWYSLNNTKIKFFL